MAKAEATVAEATGEERVGTIERRELQATGAMSGRRKLPWRCRWPDAVRDDLQARLLALDAERYQEDVAKGLHSKATKQAAKAARASAAGAAAGKRRGWSPGIR